MEKLNLLDNTTLMDVDKETMAIKGVTLLVELLVGLCYLVIVGFVVVTAGMLVIFTSRVIADSSDYTNWSALTYNKSDE